jgi:hypothetical protein
VLFCLHDAPPFLIPAIIPVILLPENQTGSDFVDALPAFLTREPSTDQGTEGRLVIPDIGFTCFTLELPWRGNASRVSCIPRGPYTCVAVDSPRFGRVYHVQAVPGRTHILIHSGNLAGDVSLGFKSNVEGCILLGSRRGTIQGQCAVLVSRATVRRFMALLAALGGPPLHLTIEGEE